MIIASAVFTLIIIVEEQSYNYRYYYHQLLSDSQWALLLILIRINLVAQNNRRFTVESPELFSLSTICLPTKLLLRQHCVLTYAYLLYTSVTAVAQKIAYTICEFLLQQQFEVFIAK